MRIPLLFLPFTLTPRQRLFLLRLLLLGLGCGALGPDTDETSLGANITQLAECVLLALVVAKLALLDSGSLDNGESSSGGGDVLTLLGCLNILGRSVTSLGLARATGEDDEALLVLLEALHVGLEGLLGEVLAAGIDGDANGGCELAGDSSSLELSEREASASADTAVVLDGRAADDGPQAVDLYAVSENF